MDIDLLFTHKGEAGLIFSRNQVKKPLGALLDTDNGLITLEYADMDHLEFNIPLADNFVAALEHLGQLYTGSVIKGDIAQAGRIPIMFLDDPYRMEVLQRVQQPIKPLESFNRFVQSCVTGQPVHREDLGDENSMGCLLGETGPTGLQFAPHLARQHAQEVRPTAVPSAPGMNAPGLGGSSGQRRSSSATTYKSPPRDDDEM